ncbi:MAG: CBASS cGAMP-activated phospholipase [Vicinamibacteria bacterium]
MTQTRRILAIDGGGIKGTFPASFLATIEEKLSRSIADYFDLIAGTSTGGIIALALGLGFSGREVLAFYETLGHEVFAGNRMLLFLRHVGFAKHNPEKLRKVLVEKFGYRKLGDSRKRLVIPSLNLENGDVHIFKTAHSARFLMDSQESAVHVAMATAAAPTYFPAHRISAGSPLVDGGTWANNPTALAVVEAVGTLGWERQDLRILSLGCTMSSLDVRYGRRYGLGWLYWADKVVEVFMAGQSSGSLGTAAVLAGPEHVFRYSPNVPAKRFGLDVTAEIESLKGLGFTEARKALPAIKQVFFAKPAEPFVPYTPA